jgi:hypothetical protein
MTSLLELYISLKANIDSFSFPIPGWEGENFINTDGYHKWTALYVKEFKPKRILELGRRNGNSLYALAYFLDDKSVIDSYDIYDCGNVVNKPNVNIIVYDGDYTKLDYNLYDFIFVDINGGGNKEYEILQLINKSKFDGISLWDDIGTTWCPNVNFWDKVTNNKLETDLHGKNNFGIIKHENFSFRI